MGLMHYSLGDYDQALAYLNKALRMVKVKAQVAQLGEVTTKTQTSANSPMTVVTTSYSSADDNDDDDDDDYDNDDEDGGNELGKNGENKDRSKGGAPPQPAIDETKDGDFGVLYNNMALCYQMKTEYTRAIVLLKKAITVDIAVFKKSNHEVALDQGNLGDTLRKDGQLQRSATLLRTALLNALADVGEEHRTTAFIRLYLGKLHMAKREWSVAENHLAKSLATRLALFGEEHDDYAKTLAALGETHVQMGSSVTSSKKVAGGDEEEKEESEAKALGAGESDQQSVTKAKGLDEMTRAYSILVKVLGNRDHVEIKELEAKIEDVKRGL